MAVSDLTTDDPKQYQLEEGQERSFIEKSSQNSESVKNLVDKLLTWIDNELSEHRILVRDIQEDLYDGQLLQKLVEKLAKIKLDHPELTLSEIGQLQRLRCITNCQRSTSCIRKLGQSTMDCRTYSSERLGCYSAPTSCYCLSI
ncbi:unnamed protein product [Schistosoma mattheei]|uniref:Calponin-homology (CH) domain-containing protein n=1 Tax=Schistosoma mattheei TaxID=31246 RepID=A0AA85BGR4_9TREM|nr:unnamed protein product [Schistosoma mattheei]